MFLAVNKMCEIKKGQNLPIKNINYELNNINYVVILVLVYMQSSCSAPMGYPAQEHLRSSQIHAPLTSQGSVGTDQDTLEKHQLVQL